MIEALRWYKSSVHLWWRTFTTITTNTSNTVEEGEEEEDLKNAEQNHNDPGTLGSRSKHSLGPSQRPNGPVLDSSAKGCRDMRTSVSMFFTSEQSMRAGLKSEREGLLQSRLKHSLRRVTLAVPRNATTIETVLGELGREEVPAVTVTTACAKNELQLDRSTPGTSWTWCCASFICSILTSPDSFRRMDETFFPITFSWAKRELEPRVPHLARQHSHLFCQPCYKDTKIFTIFFSMLCLCASYGQVATIAHQVVGIHQWQNDASLLPFSKWKSSCQGDSHNQSEHLCIVQKSALDLFNSADKKHLRIRHDLFLIILLLEIWTIQMLNISVIIL